MPHRSWKWGATARYYTSHTKTMLPRGSLCQDPAGNWTTWRPPDHRKETQTAMVWSCLPFIRSGQNHLARHSERGKKTRQTEEEVGRQHQGMDRPGACQVLEGSGEQGEMGGNWLQNHLWCPNDPRGEGMDDDDEPCRFYIKCRKQVIFFSTLNDWLLWCLFHTTPDQTSNNQEVAGMCKLASCGAWWHHVHLSHHGSSKSTHSTGSQV